MIDAILKYKNRPIQRAGEIAAGHVGLYGKELLPIESQKLHNHSPDGFVWAIRVQGLYNSYWLFT
ncbi:MAG: hypothetical protein AAF519_13860 [Bacteroidota bacterium]